VLVIHCDDERTSAGFTIDQPLRNDKGMLVTNLTRVALAPHDRLNQWIQIDADLGKKPPFRVSVRDVPRQMPMPTAAPVQPREEPAASMPAVPALGPASELPPLLPTPGQPQPLQQQPDQPQYKPAVDGSGEYGPAMSAPPASAAPPVLPRAPGAPSGAPGTPASSVQRGP
jgi:hypothetical protein